MISDCYQLQENQRKNGPLTVKTPPPLHWFPSCLVDAGRQVVGALSPADPPAAALPSSSPPPVTLPAGRSPAGQEAPQTLAAQGFPANAEKVQKPAFTAAKMGQDQAGIMGRIKRRAAKFPPVEVGEVGEGVARGSSGAVLLPSCPAPAMHPNAQQGQPLPACQAGRRAKLIFPFRYRKRLSRNNT